MDKGFDEIVHVSFKEKALNSSGRIIFSNKIRTVLGANEEGILAARARSAEVSDRVRNNEMCEFGKKEKRIKALMRPTSIYSLSAELGANTIDPYELNCRVRNGNGCDLVGINISLIKASMLKEQI